jgi:hypothetical protein
LKASSCASSAERETWCRVLSCPARAHALRASSPCPSIWYTLRAYIFGFEGWVKVKPLRASSPRPQGGQPSPCTDLAYWNSPKQYILEIALECVRFAKERESRIWRQDGARVENLRLARVRLGVGVCVGGGGLGRRIQHRRSSFTVTPTERMWACCMRPGTGSAIL